jgi:hypothetical protein
MYGLPNDTDLSFLKDATLIQVCVGENEIILNLHPQISIMFTGVVRLVSPGGDEMTSEESLQIAPALLPILGSTVVEVSFVPPGTLRLVWSSGHLLDLIDSEEHYESYTITNGDKVIVV